VLTILNFQFCSAYFLVTSSCEGISDPGISCILSEKYSSGTSSTSSFLEVPKCYSVTCCATIVIVAASFIVWIILPVQACCLHCHFHLQLVRLIVTDLLNLTLLLEMRSPIIISVPSSTICPQLIALFACSFVLGWVLVWFGNPTCYLDFLSVILFLWFWVQKWPLFWTHLLAFYWRTQTCWHCPYFPQHWSLAVLPAHWSTCKGKGLLPLHLWEGF